MSAAATPDWQNFWAPIFGLLAGLATSIALYRDYLVIKKTKLEIEKLKSELKKAPDEAWLNPMVLQKTVGLFEKIIVQSDFRFSAALKALFLCFLIMGAAVGHVWQKSQIYEMEKIVQERKTRLENIQNSNIELSNTLSQLQQSQKQNRINTNSHH